VKADGELTLKEKEEEIARLRAVAEGKNPDGLNLLDLNTRLTKTSDELVSLKENAMLEDFIGKTQVDGASDFKEALRALSRANPQAPLAELWDKNLKAGAEAAAAARKGRATTRREGASDSGRGAGQEHGRKYRAFARGVQRTPGRKAESTLDESGGLAFPVTASGRLTPDLVE
jgi:hypothetical protein